MATLISLKQKYFIKLKRFDGMLGEKDYYNPQFLKHWRGTVRDPDGRWLRYHLQKVKYFRYGKQSSPDADCKIQINLILSLIRHEKAFLYSLGDGSIKSFREWIIKLHKKQAYIGTGGKVRAKKLVSVGEHTLIVNGSVIALARKYNDPYANNGTQILYLSAISPKGCPVDKWEGNMVIHYYPDPKYFEEYIRVMEIKLNELILNLTSAPIGETLSVIAAYYQYGINMHLFEKVNQSLFANQVNILLKLLSLNPVEHGILDFVAMRLQPENFAQYFIDEVKRVNISIFDKNRIFSGKQILPLQEKTHKDITPGYAGIL